ncbi:MAG: UDP-glucose/GDP-mannose dehydrogenase family protein [Candidatus Anstonellales archaeon]
MKIAIFGAGYVGLVTGACLADMGNKVQFIDVSKEKVAQINSYCSPVYEPKLPELLKKNKARISATTDPQKALSDSEIIFICVGTPSLSNGTTDMSYLISVCREVGKAISNINHVPLIILKSTTPPQQIDFLISIIEKESGKSEGEGFYFCTNPEFLREGSAVTDFMNPDRIVVGCKKTKPKTIFSSLYKSIKAPLLFFDPKTAMMIKYASNAFLATKISFANEIGNICKKLGIDSYEVAEGMGYDKRIGRQFLNSGCGFGGSCFSKDILSLISQAKQLNINPRILISTLEVNRYQPAVLISILQERIGSLKGKRIGLLGLSFKPNTDDIRESPAIAVSKMLLSSGANVIAYDPAASENFKKAVPEVKCSKSKEEVIQNSDAILILSDWKEFEDIDTDKYVLEGKRILKKKKNNYEGICW